MVYVEKEIKLKVENFDNVISKLKKLNAKFLGKTFQRTIRFEKGEGELEKKGLFLRVRKGFKNELTMKIKKNNDNVFEREEIEIEVEDTEKVRRIINNLGFDKEKIMEKNRSKWQLGEVDICLDELPFGNFIEIEGEEKKIFETVEKLGLKKENKIIVTYWDLSESEDIVFPED